MKVKKKPVVLMAESPLLSPRFGKTPPSTCNKDRGANKALLRPGGIAMSMEQNKEHAFDAFCKRVVKNEAVNIQLEYSRQEQQEVVFSDLTPEERRQLQYIDTYAPERRVFRLFGMDMEISDGNLGRALDAVSKERRDIVLLAYLLGMTDVEIAKRLGLNRSTVQYRRTSTLEQLRKIMEENGYEYHKQ